MIKVLVLDDDEDLLEMVTLMLKASEMNVCALANGDRLWEILKSEQPDVVVMDIFLGDEDGRVLCQQIKSDKEYANVPVLLYSAGNIPPSTFQNACADAFLQKPFNMSELVGQVRELSALKRAN